MTNTVLTLLSADRLAAYFRQGFWRDDTIYALARRHAERAPGSFAVRDASRRLTYQQLIATVDELAADMDRRGVRAGQRVAVWLPSRIESAIVLLACSRNGYMCCPSLHRDHTVGEVVDLIVRMEASAVFARAGYGADAGRHDVFTALATLPFVKQVYRIDTESAAPFHGYLEPTAPRRPMPTPTAPSTWRSRRALPARRKA
jgi:non-ribosomal peptide synthetase component E (peptide arylation enzyme)